MKKCKKCEEEKEDNEFYKSRKVCKKCVIKINTKNYNFNKEIRIEQINLKRYGITKESHLELIFKQDNKCAICGKTQEYKELAIDHCHHTNKVRGLLCLKCNKGLGLLGDNVAELLKAITYLIDFENKKENKDD